MDRRACRRPRQPLCPGLAQPEPGRRTAGPRAVVLESAGVAAILGTKPEQRLSAGEVVFLGVIEERAHFALDLSPVEAPLEMLQSPALAASGAARFADLRQVGPRIERREGA